MGEGPNFISTYSNNHVGVLVAYVDETFDMLSITLYTPYKNLIKQPRTPVSYDNIEMLRYTASPTGLCGHVRWSLPHPSTLQTRAWVSSRRSAGLATAGEPTADDKLEQK